MQQQPKNETLSKKLTGIHTSDSTHVPFGDIAIKCIGTIKH